ncbi:hypothetical protein SARC_16913, partial [Sphaeroforma arctica JP610]
TDRGQIIGLFVLCQTLAHAFNLMTTTGVMSFYTYMKGYHDGTSHSAHVIFAECTQMCCRTRVM